MRMGRVTGRGIGRTEPNQAWSRVRRALTRVLVLGGMSLALVGCDDDSDTSCEGWIVKEHRAKNGTPYFFLRRESPRPMTHFKIGGRAHEACQEANRRFGLGSFRSSLAESSDSDPLSGRVRQASAIAAPTPSLGFQKYAADIAIADLDGDGQEDVATVFKGVNAVTVMRTDGVNFLAPVDFPAGVNPKVLRVGDVNRDGKQDLLTANLGTLEPSGYSGGTVSLLLGNGDGTFQSGVAIAAGDVPNDLELGDFNEDGNLDLAVADTPNAAPEALRICIGNGDGTFQPAASIDAPTARSLVVADLNADADNHDDIITNGSILLGRGDGTFAPAVGFPFGFDIILSHVAVGDLNGDRKPDVVSGSLMNELVSVFLGQGDGTLAAPRHYAVHGPPNEIEIGDQDEDGAIDVIAANSSGGGARLLGNGDGTFQAAELYPTIENATRRLGADGTAVADFTGDGVPDIVAANGGFWQGSVAQPIFGGSPAVLLRGLGDGRFAAAVALPGQAGAQVAAGDWNGDRRQDLAFTGEGVDKPQLFIALGRGDGTFGAATRIDLPGERRFGVRFLAAAPVNADSAPDLLVANFSNGDVSVFLGDGQGGFAAQEPVPIGRGVNGLATGDLNGDGRLDLVASYQGQFGALDGGVSMALGEGNGMFRAAQAVRTNVAPDSIVLADLNRDGHLDLATSLEVRRFDWDVEVLLGRGDGTFGTPLAAGLTDDLIGGVAVADADLDGRPDLAVSAGGRQLVGLRGRGDGRFEPALSGVTGGGRTIAADVDRNGLPDMVSALGNGFVAVLPNRAIESGLARPALELLRLGGAVELSWPRVFESFGLRETDNPSEPISWKDSTNIIDLVNDRFRARIETTKHSRFFRLENNRCCGGI